MGLEKEEMYTKQTEKDDDADGFFGPALPPGYTHQDKSPEG